MDQKEMQRRGVAIAVSIAVCGFSGARLAHADQQATIEEIIITAQKREENLQKVPVSVTAIGAQELEQRGISNLGNLVGVAMPGIYVQPFSGQKSVFNLDMRGVTTGDVSQGTIDPGTAVVIDDVYNARGSGLGFSPAEIDRIEILRGPQGTLFGRNAEGGAIRVVTKGPTGVLGGNVKVGFGDYDTKKQEAHLNLPEFNGLSIKLDAKHEENDGDTKNIAAAAPLGHHSNPGAFEGDGYKLSALFKPVENFTASYDYTYSEMKSSKGVNHKGYPPAVCQGGVACGAAITTVAAPFSDLTNRVSNTWLGLYNGPNDVEITTNRLGLEWKLPNDMTLKSITSTNQSTEFIPANTDQGVATRVSFGPAGISGAALRPAFGTGGIASAGFGAASTLYGAAVVVNYAKVKSDQTSQEFQLLGESKTTKWVTGLYYFRENAIDTRDTAFSAVYQGFAVGVPINPIATNPFFVGASALAVTESRVRSWAGFGQLTWTPESNQQLHLTGGLRYSHDYRTFHRSFNAGLPSNIDQPTIDAGRTDGNATLAYDFTDTINGYIRLATGYRAGGSSVRSPWTGAFASFATFHNEIVHSFEAGIKSELLDRRLRLNVAAYENRINGKIIAVQLIPTNQSVTALINLPGITQTRGIETEAAFAVTDRFTVSGNLSFQNYSESAETKNYITRNDPGAQYNITGMPRWMGAIGADYRFPVAIGTLVAHADWNKSAQSYGTERIAAGAFAPKIWIDQANARLTLQDVKTGPATLKFSVYVTNMFDSIHPIFSTPQNTWVSSFPRTYGVEIGADF